MKRSLLLLMLGFTQLMTPVRAQPTHDWLQLNDRVREAGGWKAYARERSGQAPAESKPKATTPLSLAEALKQARGLEPGLTQTLAITSHRLADYPRLNHAQREALIKDQRQTADITTLYYGAVAAQQRLTLQRDISEIRDIAAELIRRMRKAGNTNDLHALEKDLDAGHSLEDLSAALLEYEESIEAVKLRLQLGAAVPALSLSDGLPDPPARLQSLSEVDERLLLITSNNPAVLRIQSEVRLALLARQESHKIVQIYRTRLLPAQKKVSEETLLHYNGMILGIFELLKDAENHTKLQSQYLSQLLKFWSLESALQTKLAALREELINIGRDAWN